MEMFRRQVVDVGPTCADSGNVEIRDQQIELRIKMLQILQVNGKKFEISYQICIATVHKRKFNTQLRVVGQICFQIVVENILNSMVF